MKIVAIIPIKLNNERLSGKNLKVLGNKPLIQYILHTLMDIPIIDVVYVYCSDKRVCDVLPEGIRFLKRPEYVDSQSARFNHIFDCFISEIEADIYVYTHATAPFLRAETIMECIEEVDSGRYDSAFTVSKIQDFLWMDGKPLNFVRLMYREVKIWQQFIGRRQDCMCSRVDVIWRNMLVWGNIPT
jgi:CMP-N-acetylneuraminic acid synthetase